MVIHHGGAGTTASVLHAGVPNIVIPQIGDQWFFASEIKRIGVGLEVKRRTWPEDLPKAVSAVEKAKSMRLRATKVAELLSREDGPSSAVRILESLLNQKI
jgi:UDP:flavonoid glycosyltransferase YjiC (YdhE family)